MGKKSSGFQRQFGVLSITVWPLVVFFGHTILALAPRRGKCHRFCPIYHHTEAAAMVPPSARFPTRRAALAEEAAAGRWPGLGRSWFCRSCGADRAGAAGPAGRCGVRIMRHAANTDRGTDPMRAPPPRLAVRHLPVGDHLPCSSAPGAGAGRRPGSLTPCLGLRRAGGAGSKAAFPRCAALPAGRCPAGVLPLWQALARQSGGAVVFDSGAQFAAAAFLPLCPGCRIQKSPSTQELLEDRFSLPYLFLSGYCAGPW